MKKYDIVEKLRIVKDILNVFKNDAKRFSTLVNKFKKLEFKYVLGKDGNVASVSVSDIPDDIFDIFLDSANSNARSEKVKTLLSNILDNKALVADIKKEKAPVKKKEKVKAKPAKEAKEAKSKEIKATKEKTKVGVVGLVDEKIANWVNSSFDDKMLKKIQDDILDAFKTDSRLNVTMQNWMKKSSDLKTQVINMFTTAYNRKPNNGKMKNAGWYSAFDKWAGNSNAVEAKPKKEAKATKEVKEVKPKEVKATKEAKKVVYETYNLSVFDSLFVNIRCSKANASSINCSLRDKDIDQIASVFSLNRNTDIKLTDYKVTMPKLPDNELKNIEKEIITTIFKAFVVKNKSNQSENELFEEEGNYFGSGIENVFVTNIILNLINCVSGGIGLGSNNVRIKVTEAICTNLNLTEQTKDADKISKFYLEELNNLNQIEAYTLNRKIVKSVIMEILAADIVVPYFNIFGQYVLNSLCIIKAPGIQIVRDSIEETIAACEKAKPKEQEVIGYTITAREISFVFQGTSFNIPKNSDNYSSIYQAVLDNDHDKLGELVTSQQKLAENVKAVVSQFNDEESDKIEIKIIDKIIYCNNKVFKGLASMEFLKYVAENNAKMISQFKRFMFNCSLNPSNASVEELYDFVVKNKLKVTPAGTILLYKWVKNNYYDCHTGKFNNTPGLTVKMDRKRVNPNRHETCSNGLHLCSYKYGKFGDRLLLVELDPKNSVSIPSDYNQSKMRCCEYTILMDITEFVGAMDAAGDFLSRVENIHYNTKIIETELMKMYPEVVRKNSINGLNDLTGAQEDKISAITMNFEIPELKVIDVTDNDDFFEDENESSKETVEVAKVEDSKEQIVEESDEPENIIESIEPTESIASKETEELMIEDETKDDISLDENLTAFLEGGEYDNSLFSEKNSIEVINKLKVIDDIIYNYAVQRVDQKSYNTTEERMHELLASFRFIRNDEVSITQIPDEAKKNATKIEVDNSKNPDNITIVETPKAETVIGKIGKMFRKLW